VFAGSELKAAVCKASNVERLLGVSFTEVTPTPAPSWLFWGLVGLGLYLAAREYRVI
jgi:MYXO-CTERM domain-containing protein